MTYTRRVQIWGGGTSAPRLTEETYQRLSEIAEHWSELGGVRVGISMVARVLLLMRGVGVESSWDEQREVLDEALQEFSERSPARVDISTHMT